MTRVLYDWVCLASLVRYIVACFITQWLAGNVELAPAGRCPHHEAPTGEAMHHMDTHLVCQARRGVSRSL
jgi:nitrite reductase/ring-hydroxylating ferredoxin subunit